MPIKPKKYLSKKEYERHSTELYRLVKDERAVVDRRLRESAASKKSREYSEAALDKMQLEAQIAFLKNFIEDHVRNDDEK